MSARLRNRHATIPMLALLVAACGGNVSPSDPIPTGQPPVAKIDAPSGELADLSHVVLSAEESSDPDGDTLSFEWQQVSGPDVSLSAVADPTVTVMLPRVNGTEVVVLSVTVNDGNGNAVTEAVELSVRQQDTVIGLGALENSHVTKPFRIHPVDEAPVSLANLTELNGQETFADAKNMLVSPDGKLVAWFSDSEDDGTFGVMIADIGGAKARRITQIQDRRNFEKIQWSADSRFIFLQTRGEPGTVDFLHRSTVNLEGELKILRLTPTPNGSGLPKIDTFSISPNGSTVALLARMGQSSSVHQRLFMSDHENELGQWREVSGVFDESTVQVGVQFGSWSPDGAQFVFAIDRNNDSNYELALTSSTATANSSPTRLVDPEHLHVKITNNPKTLPRFSPDGVFIAFNASPPDDPDNQGLYVIQADGENLRRVSGDTVPGGKVENVEWSPNSQSLAVVGALETAGQDELFVLSIDGSERRKVSGEFTDIDEPVDGFVDGDVGEDDFRWSPDGTHLVFEGLGMTRKTGADIFIVGASGDGSDRRKVSGGFEDLGNGFTTKFFGPQWSPDGRNLYFLGDLQGPAGYEIFKVPADTTDGGERVSISGPLPVNGFVSEFVITGPGN